MMLMMLQQSSIFNGTTAVIGGLIFFLVFAVAAFIVFKLLKRSVKMALRMLMVGMILLIAIAGSVAIWYAGSGSNPRPGTNRSR